MYFTMKKCNRLRPGKTFLVMLCFLLVCSCSKDKEEGNGKGGDGNGDDGNGDPTKYTLTIDKPTSGTTTSNVGDINCGSEGDDVCKAEFDEDTEVILTAKADTGYVLGDWEGACDKTDADQPCKLTMDANKNVSKAFTITQRSLSITLPTNGTITHTDSGINCGTNGDGTCTANFDYGTEVTLTATADTGYAPAAWQGDDCDKTDADQPCTLSMDANKTAGLMFGIDTDMDGDPDITDPDDDNDTVLDETDVDDDNDGLIEVHNLDMFNHIQYNMAGTSYKNSRSATDNRMGAPEASTADCTTAVMSTIYYLCGYELTGDLDFAEGASYADGTVNNNWRPNGGDADTAANEGFVGPNDFASIFEGNGFAITHLYSRGGGNRALFRKTAGTATIRNLEIADAHLYGGSGAERIGGLVGRNNGSILDSHVTGSTVNGGDGDDDVGGLVGQNRGSITASYATGSTVNGGVGADKVGALVGQSISDTTITASYATGGDANGDDGTDNVGGLVGHISTGTTTLTASYATGAVNGGVGADNVGGLVGYVSDIGTKTIMASHATGAANGDDGDDKVGGLVGAILVGTNTITASYATGTANGGAGNDNVGGLVGLMTNGTNTITACYATGAANGGVGNDAVGGLVGVTEAGSTPRFTFRTNITASYATGNPDGGDDVGTDDVGALVGKASGANNTITHSYAFGTPANDDTTGNAGTTHPAGLMGSGAAKANGLTDPSGSENTDAAAEWDQTASDTKDAWDFGTTSQLPALRYADYDGDGSGTDYCALFPAKIPGTDTDLVCGTSLLPGQGR